MTDALDDLDVRILEILQDDASLPLRTLAHRVHASTATCQRRIARMRSSGVLLKQVALVDRKRVGRPLTVFVQVELEAQNEALLQRFEQRVAIEPDVMSCWEVSGEFDFLLMVTARSMESFHLFTRRLFTAANGVRNFKSVFAMSCTKLETRVPLDGAEGP